MHSAVLSPESGTYASHWVLQRNPIVFSFAPIQIWTAPLSCFLSSTVVLHHPQRQCACQTCSPFHQLLSATLDTPLNNFLREVVYAIRFFGRGKFVDSMSANSSGLYNHILTETRQTGTPQSHREQLLLRQAQERHLFRCPRQLLERTHGRAALGPTATKPLRHVEFGVASAGGLFKHRQVSASDLQPVPRSSV